MSFDTLAGQIEASPPAHQYEIKSHKSNKQHGGRLPAGPATPSPEGGPQVASSTIYDFNLHRRFWPRHLRVQTFLFTQKHFRTHTHTVHVGEIMQADLFSPLVGVCVMKIICTQLSRLCQGGDILLQMAEICELFRIQRNFL